MCFETTYKEMTNDPQQLQHRYSSIQSARPSTSTGQRLFKLDTTFSRLSRHFSGVLFERCEMSCTHELVSITWSFFTVKTSTLADKIQFTFTSSLCTISSSFWWHTPGENIDTYGGTNQQQQQVSHICCLSVCLVC